MHIIKISLWSDNQSPNDFSFEMLLDSLQYESLLPVMDIALVKLKYALLWEQTAPKASHWKFDYMSSLYIA